MIAVKSGPFLRADYQRTAISYSIVRGVEVVENVSENPFEWVERGLWTFE